MKKVFASVGFAAAWWTAVAVEVGVVGNVPGLAAKTAHGFVLNGAGSAVHLALVMAITAAITAVHSRRARDVSSLAFAALLVGLGLALDAALTAPLFVGSFAAYFGKLTVWAGYALAFAVAHVTGRALGRRELESAS